MCSKLVTTQTDWRYKIIELNARLNVLQPRLINAEAELAEQLAKLHAFEFRLRTLTNPILRNVEKIDQEISKLRRQLTDLGNGLKFNDEDYQDEQFDDFDVKSGEEAGSNENFRYRDDKGRQQTRAKLSSNEETELKKLYRQLARRFHPDLGKSPQEREERTQLMMQINAAYHAGDLKGLSNLSKMPDPRASYATDDRQIEAEKLQRAFNRCQARLREIREQMERLAEHKTAHLLERYERNLTQGRDILNEIVQDIKRELARRAAERDQLREQLENIKKASAAEGEDKVAETILQMGLELGLDDDDTAPDSTFHSVNDDTE